MDRDLIAKFIEVTGEGEATAAQYLSLADGNLESAITLLFEAAGSGAISQDQVPTISPDEPEVRPPILPTQEILVPPDVTCSIPRASNNVFDRFRDFAVETRRQEEEMTRRAAMSRNSGYGKKMSQRQSRQQKRLEDLFRPPCDLLFLGSFLEAREYAKNINRWLLVNVQNQQEFACQILNRDIWSNQQVREIVKDHFVLLQVLSTTEDGKRYIDFYKVESYPYLAIVDPRTGECIRSYNNITIDILISGLNDMLSSHPSPENNMQESSVPVPSVINFPIASSLHGSLQSDAISNSNIPQNTKRVRNLDKCPGTSGSNSGFKANSGVSTSSNSTVISKRSRLEEMTEKEKQIQKEIRPESPVEIDGPVVKICLRLPCGNKETMTMSANQTIGNFLQKMEDMGFEPSEYTYLTSFPKTNIGELSVKLRLIETILHPSNTVFITKI